MRELIPKFSIEFKLVIVLSELLQLKLSESVKLFDQSVFKFSTSNLLMRSAYLDSLFQFSN